MLYFFDNGKFSQYSNYRRVKQASYAEKFKKINSFADYFYRLFDPCHCGRDTVEFTDFLQNRTIYHPIDALFTAVSATCVTGLTVIDTSAHWSLFGQVILLLLIEIGGLGFMTLVVSIFLLLNQKMSLKSG